MSQPSPTYTTVRTGPYMAFCVALLDELIGVSGLESIPNNRPCFAVLALEFFMITVVSNPLKEMAQSPFGLAFRAIGQNMEAARTSGINQTRYRIINFTLSCALAEWLGGFYAHYLGVLMLSDEFCIELTTDPGLDMDICTVVVECHKEEDIPKMKPLLRNGLKEECQVTPEIKFVPFNTLERTTFKAKRIVDKRQKRS